MSESQFLNHILSEYQRLLNERREFEKWKEENPERYEFQYPGIKPNKSELERYGKIARKSMVKIEGE